MFVISHVNGSIVCRGVMPRTVITGYDIAIIAGGHEAERVNSVNTKQKE